MMAAGSEAARNITRAQVGQANMPEQWLLGHGHTHTHTNKYMYIYIYMYTTSERTRKLIVNVLLLV